MITYKEDTKITVKLDGKVIGTIKTVKDGDLSKDAYQYFPKGSKTGGKKYSQLNRCKQSLEE